MMQSQGASNQIGLVLREAG